MPERHHTHSQSVHRPTTPPGSLLQRFTLNAAAYGYAQVATIAVQFLQVPLFLYFWGVERYGEWIVLAGIPLMLGVVDLGVCQASASKSSLEAGRGNWAAARDTLQTAKVYTLGISALTVLVVAALSMFVDWSQILRLSSVDRVSASSVLIIMTGALACSMQGGYIDAWMRCYNEPALSGFISANLRVAETVTAGVLLYFGGGFVAVACGYLAAAVLVRVVHGAVASARALPEIQRFGSFSRCGLLAVAKPATGFIAISLTQALTIQGGIQVLNQVASASVVVAFSMARTLVRLIFQLGVVLNNSLRAEFSRMVGEGRRTEAVSFLWKVWIASGVFGLAGYVAVVVAGPDFIHFWSAGKVSVTHGLIALVGLHAVLGLLWYVPASLEMAENRHARFAFYYGGTAVLTLALWIAFRDWVEPQLAASLLLAVPHLAMVVLVFSRSPWRRPEQNSDCCNKTPITAKM
jgi:O-antigen/teichoic acid export membrane protein